MRKLTRRLVFLLGWFNILTINLHATSFSGTLPVMFINTEDSVEIVSKEEYVNATAWLDNLGLEQFEAVGSEEEPLELQIRGRGNYTWTHYDKKPYRLKFTSKQTFLDIPKSKHFALLAAAGDDFGFMRDPIGFYLSKVLGLPWTPEIRPVEVVLNGEYIGLYFLTETVRVDKNRVNIVEQSDEATNPEEITGGWLVEKDNNINDPHIVLYEHNEDHNPIIITYHTPEVLSDPQLEYLTEQMNLINDAIYIEDVDDNTWEEYVDVEMLARYYIVQEIIDDVEAFSGSCYFYKDIGEDSKWQFGPVWDFGNAFHSTKSMFIFEDPCFHSTWIGAVYRHTHFVEVVKEIWKEIYPSLYDNLEIFINDFVKTIRPASLTNYERWPQYGNNDMSTRLYLATTRLNKSIEWLNEQWGDPEQPIDPNNHYEVSFDNDQNWENVYAFVWYEDENKEKIEVVGPWPGITTAPDEFGLYQFTFYFENLPLETCIWFHNGEEAQMPEVDGFIFQNGCKYNSSGIIQSAVQSIDSENEPIYLEVNGNIMKVSSDENTIVTISDIYGRELHIDTKYNNSRTFILPSGFYLINGQKVFIR